jgi:hypothetical protein
MPLPIILAGAVSALSALIVADNLVTGGRVSDEIGKRAAQAVLDARGIPLDLDGEVSEETITEAINAAVMPDEIVFRNLFDKATIEADVKRIALDYAAEAFGFEGGLSPAGIKQKIMSEIVSEVLADIGAGSGDYLEATAGLVEIENLLTRPEPKDWKKIRNFTEKGEKNRERQARYRESHSRKWI